jgi:hypothetical protein
VVVVGHQGGDNHEKENERLPQWMKEATLGSGGKKTPRNKTMKSSPTQKRTVVVVVVAVKRC